MNYQPKGSQCAACTKKFDDCSQLPFDKMKGWGFIIETKTTIVICNQFKRAKYEPANTPTNDRV